MTSPHLDPVVVRDEREGGAPSPPLAFPGHFPTRSAHPAVSRSPCRCTAAR